MRFTVVLFLTSTIYFSGWRFYTNVGCFRDRGNRAINPLDGKLTFLRGNYRARKDAIEKCAAVAALRGHKVFGVQHGGWCASSPTGHRTYGKYGRAKNCKNGKGGAWANDVYKLKGEDRLRALCHHYFYAQYAS